MAKKTDPKKAIKGERYGDSMKYQEFRKDDKGGRNAGTTGRKKMDQFAAGTAPRVGGGPSVPSIPLSGGTKKQVKASKSMVRKGTGSGASAQAKRSVKKLK